MKRSFTILTAAFMLLAFLAIPMGMIGQTSVTWPGTTALPGTATAVANDQNITIMVSSTNTYTNPIRIYANTTITIEAQNDAKILSVNYEASSTGNYVTVAQNATVTPNVTPTVNGKIVTWSYTESANVTAFTFTPSAQTRSNGITITYIIPGATPTCATPTFSPAAGTYTQAQNVSISCATEGATIYYTTNGDTPTTNSAVYTEAISVSSNMTIKAMATAEGYDNSAVATAEYAFITLDHAGTLEDPYTVADARAAIDANTGTQNVYAIGIVSAIVTAYDSGFENITFDMVDEEGNEATLRAYRCGGDEAADVAVGDIAVVYGSLTKYGSTYEFGQGCQLVSLTHPVITVPTVIVTPNTINAPAEGADGTLALTYENITDFTSFDYYFCDAEGNELQEDPDWIYAEINEENDVYFMDYIIDANNGAARSAYFKVYTFDDELEEVFAIVTVNQEEYVAPTYATLPFEFNGGKEGIEGTDGLYQEGLGSDYNGGANATTPLKFDDTDDWLLLQFDERPGTLTFDITGNGFSNGNFTVETSEDGIDYTDLAVYTRLGATQHAEFNLGENVRYIKWIYSTKAIGNVGLGTIALTAYEAPQPAITLNSYLIEATAAETEGSLTVTYTEIETSLGASIYWFESDGETTATEPTWVSADINTELNVEYLIEENEGAARTAYFKVYGVDAELNDVYSNLVTISQAAAPQQYMLTVEPFENLELITFVNDEMVMEGDGEIQVNEGDQIMLSIVADPGYTMETLMVNNVNHVNDIASDFTYTFDMPAENVTISATAVESVAPAGGNYVRITSLNQLTDGNKVIIAARHDEENTNGYYAMKGVTAGKPDGVAFTSETSSNDEILPASITTSEDTYYWTVNVTNDGYTFTNANNQMIGYTSGTNFATGGNNTEWTITRETAAETTMVSEYTGFVIRNSNTNNRAFAFNGTAFGAYATSNMTGQNSPNYNFYLDFFVQTEAVEPETYTLDITGYEAGSNGGYYLIASPVTVDPEEVEGMTTGDFDLYYFDEAEDNEWRNYEANAFNLVPGKGYLYAKQATTEGEIFHFELTGTPYDGNGTIELNYTEGGDFPGWNLIGNPYNEEAGLNLPFYRMNTEGTEVEPVSQGTVNPMEGVFVIAQTDPETGDIINAQFTAGMGSNSGDEKLVLNVSRNRGNVIDRAIVRFDQGGVLPKFQLNENSTKLYIVEGENEYAVVRSASEGEMPVNFKASENGNYTLSVNTENMEMEYLHLIDNMTGADIDLLATPSYSFEARTNDYESRFRLVFSGNTNVGSSTSSETFAFFNGNSWVINNEGEATLQVIDMMGRVLSNEQINGSYNNSLNLSAGVYVLRLSNGNTVKTQKVVVD